MVILTVEKLDMLRRTVRIMIRVVGQVGDAIQFVSTVKKLGMLNGIAFTSILVVWKFEGQ